VQVGFVFLLVLFAYVCTMTGADAARRIPEPQHARTTENSDGCFTVPRVSTGERLNTA